MVSGIRNDNWLARTNSIARYGALIEAGAELHEYNRRMLHHKVMVVDGNRSFVHNEESGWPCGPAVMYEWPADRPRADVEAPERVPGCQTTDRSTDSAAGRAPAGGRAAESARAASRECPTAVVPVQR